MMSFVYGIAGLALFIVAAPAMQYLGRFVALRIPPVIILAITALVSHLTGAGIGFINMPQFQYWNAASIFAFGAIIYVFAFGAVYKSVSLGILLDLINRPDQEAPLSDIVEQEIPALFRARTAILTNGGLVTEDADSSFLPTASGRKLADRIARLRRAFGIGNTGLYDFAD